MNPVSRRTFLAGASMAAATALVSKNTLAAVRPVGLQLYSVRRELPNDYVGTLQKVAAIGYRDVEAAGFYNHSAPDVKKIMSDVGLRCISAHNSLTDLLKTPDATVEYGHTLGLKYLICAAPTVADTSRFAQYPGGSWEFIQHGMTADDWKWNAEQFNKFGEKARAAGIQFGYHNHTPEFRDVGNGLNGYQILQKETEPSLVTFELDCGWATVAGQDAAKLIGEYGKRITMLHLKDFGPAPAGQPTDKRASTEIGYGIVDFKPLLSAANAAEIAHAFIEQEEFDKPTFEALKIDYNNINTLDSGGSVSKTA